MNVPSQYPNLIGVVGPCSAGKSTLIRVLQKMGYECRHIAQEHSYVPYMWKKIANPRILVYLDVSYDVSMARKNLNMSQQEFDEQRDRLDHARQHAEIYLDTDQLSPDEVLRTVLRKLDHQDIQPQD